MRFSTFLSLLAALPSCLSASSSKRGLVYVPSPQHPEDDKIWTQASSDLTWYYNYQATPSSSFSNTKLEFIPMLWGDSGDENDMTFFNSVKGLIDSGQNISHVLAFNEPDGGQATGGSGVSASTAAATWARQIEPLKKMGVKLGAPAVTGAPTGKQWLQDFFTACNGNCSVDFIPIHWYGNFEGLASHIGEYRAAFGENVTMWVTEYALAHEELNPTQGFYNMSAEYFDRLDYLTHYSYFGSFRSSVSNVGNNAAMLNQDGKLTDIGSWYLGGSATGNVPKGGASTSASLFAGWTVTVGLAALWSFF